MKILKKSTYLHCFALALGFLLLTACDSDKETPTPDPDEGKEVEFTWTVPEYSVKEVRTYSKAQMIDHAISSYEAMLDATAYAALKNLLTYSHTDGYTYIETVLEYQSKDHLGNPVTLSGIVDYRISKSDTSIGEIVVDSHATITDDASCPSNGGDFVSLLTLKGNYAVIAADYQGYGSSSTMMHPYLNRDVTAAQELDMMKVALDYLKNGDSGASLSNSLSTYSVGYSQGGAAALALHRLLETSEPTMVNAIGFSGSVCGDGPYSLVNTFVSYSSQGYVTIPVVLPMMVRSMIESYPTLFAGLTLEDFFTPEFLAAGGGIMNLIDSKQLNTLAFNVVLGAQDPLNTQFPLTSILKAEALQQGPQLQAIIAAASLNNCIQGWTPTKRVGFFHSQSDTVVPFANLADAQEWPENIYTIKYPSDPEADHLKGAILFYSDLLLKGPAAMQQ